MTVLITKFLRNSTKNRIFLTIFLLLSLSGLGLIYLSSLWKPENHYQEAYIEKSKSILPSEKNIDKPQKPIARTGNNEKLKPNRSPSQTKDEQFKTSKKIMVRGSVINQEGEGISQAEVFLFPLAPMRTTSSYGGQSDASGFFTIEDVPVGDFKLFARKGNFSSLYVFSSSQGENVENVKIILPPLGKIIGVISDKAGSPIPKVIISIFPMESSETQKKSMHQLKSRKDGTFQIEKIDLNIPVKLCFSKKGFLDYEERVDFVSGVETYPLEIVMDESGWICGRITDEVGNPIYKAKVYLRGGEKLNLKFFQTDRDGFFKAVYLQEHFYNILVLAKKFALKRVNTIPINSPELTIVLTKGGTMSGRVVFGRLNPSQPFTMEPIPSKPTGIEQYNPYRVRSFHNPENEFTLHRLPPGEYTLKVESEGWAVTYKGQIYIPEDGLMEDISIPLEREIQLTGRAYKWNAGETFPSVLVYLARADGPYIPFLSKVSDKNGKFIFRRIPRGAYLIVAGRGDFRYKSAKFSLEPGTEYEEFPITLEENPDIELPAQLHSPIVGIGAILGRHENVVGIERVIRQGPAERGGLQKGDLIIEVDHYLIEGSTLSEVIDRIRGEENTPVVLGIDRGGYYFQEEIIRHRIGY